ncbi:hypothetical protein WA158_005469 [Blastocystis sp. Blastoise]
MDFFNITHLHTSISKMLLENLLRILQYPLVSILAKTLCLLLGMVSIHFIVIGGMIGVTLDKKSIENNIDVNNHYIYTSHPHAFLPFIGGWNLMTDMNGISKYIDTKNLYLGTVGMCYLVPIYRDLLLWGGCVDCRRSVLTQSLRDQHSILLYTGGALEALLVQNNRNDIYIPEKLGFIKLAIETGTSLIPTYTYNENNMWCVRERPSKLLHTLCHFTFYNLGFSLPPLQFPFIKRPSLPICTVVGRPIPVEKKETYTEEYLQSIYTQYVNELNRLYEQYKDIYAPNQSPLEVKKIHDITL